jgi:hypothetical protein
MVIHTAAPTEQFHEKLVIWKTDGVLLALNLRGYETRNESVLRLIDRADREHALPDFAPLMVHTGDQPANPGDPTWRSLAFSTAEGYEDVPVPDFLFDGWPQVGLGDYEAACATAAAAGATEPATAYLGWIGNCDTHPSRWELHRIGAEHPDLFEIVHVTWVPDHASGGPLTTAAGNQMTLEEQVRRWSLLFDIEGRGWSARLKLLLHSGRPVLVQERPWHEWFWPALRPMEHYVPVRRDLSDLVERARWAREHPGHATRIGRAGQAFAREHLTRSAAVGVWAQTLARLAGEGTLPCAPPGQQGAIDEALRALRWVQD